MADWEFRDAKSALLRTYATVLLESRCDMWNLLGKLTQISNVFKNLLIEPGGVLFSNFQNGKGVMFNSTHDYHISSCLQVTTGFIAGKKCLGNQRLLKVTSRGLNAGVIKHSFIFLPGGRTHITSVA